MSRIGDGRFDKPLYAHEPILTAENRLWRAVLQQAYEDAEQPQMADGVDPETRARAQRYLRADPGAEIDQLKLVCYFAEVPFDRVVSFARKRYRYVPAEEIPTVRRGRPRAQCASRGVSVERSARHCTPAAIVQTQEAGQSRETVHCLCSRGNFVQRLGALRTPRHALLRVLPRP